MGQLWSGVPSWVHIGLADKVGLVLV